MSITQKFQSTVAENTNVVRREYNHVDLYEKLLPFRNCTA